MTTDNVSEWSSSTETQKAIQSEYSKHWLWILFRDLGVHYSPVLLASLLINIFALATPLFIRHIYDKVIPYNDLELLWFLVMAVFAVLVFDFVLRTLRAYIIDHLGKSIDIRVSDQILTRLLGLKLSARSASVGSLANAIHAFEGFREFVTSATLSTLVDIPFVILFLALIAVIGGNLVWVPLVAIPAILSVNLLIQSPLSKLIQQTFQESSKKQALLIETLGAIESIKTLGAEDSIQGRYHTLSNSMALLTNKIKFLSNLSSHFAFFAQTLASIFLVVAGVYQMSTGTLSIGALLACSILSARALSPISQLTILFNRYQQAKTGLAAVNHLMHIPQEKAPESQWVSLPTLTGNIELTDLHFRYPMASTLALSGINLKINAGEHIGIIGRTGSGKTTLEKIILKLYEPDQGRILIDGVDSTQIDPTILRRHIGYVPQNVILFEGSIRDNILMGIAEVDEAAFLRAATLSGVTDFVQDHPEGFNRAVGERGEQLSGGQRQAIALARALLQDPPLLLLDEPSNGLDDETTEALIQRLQAVLRHKTLILITHKTSLLRWVERIIVMDNSRIVADGLKETVLKQLSEGKVKKVSSYHDAS